MKAIKIKKPQLRRAEWSRRSQEFLAKIQQELMPAHASDIVAINMETGEYLLGKSPGEVAEAFWEKWPDVLMFTCRIDGGPTTKFHGL